MSAKDLITMPRLGSPIVSNDGVLAIYRVTHTDAETLKRKPSYYLLDLGAPNASPIALDLGMEAHSLAFGPTDAIYLSLIHI